jgi:hypothetical protein
MLEAIIPHINQKIETLNMFPKLFGLCEKITVGGKSFPAEYCNGEYKQVSDFDLHQSSIYHRLLGPIQMEEADEDEAVSCDPFYNRIFQLRAVAVIQKSRLKEIGNDAYLENKIGQNLANVISKGNNKSLRIELSVDTVIMEIDSVNTDREEIFRQEYSGIDQFMRYEYLYIAIDYTVTVTGGMGCFSQYGCTGAVNYSNDYSNDFN